MSRKTLRQYLESMHNSGVENIFLTETETKAVHSESTNDITVLLKQKNEQYKDCKNCILHQQRINFVYGEGNPSAKLMLIGEGPGSEENKQGRPFVGRAGQLLTKMLLAINLEREEVYITNVVKCQPPGNRNPLIDEVSSCLPYLKEQIEIISPKMIVLLGKVAASALFDTKEPMSVLREKHYSFAGIDTFITYHPAALIYNESLKKESWKDLKKIRALYDSYISK